MNLVMAPALYARLPAKPDIHTALSTLGPGDRIRDSAQADPSDGNRKRNRQTSLKLEDTDVEEEEEDGTDDIEIDVTRTRNSEVAVSRSSEDAHTLKQSQIDRHGIGSKTTKAARSLGSQSRPIELSESSSQPEQPEQHVNFEDGQLAPGSLDQISPATGTPSRCLQSPPMKRPKVSETPKYAEGAQTKHNGNSSSSDPTWFAESNDSGASRKRRQEQTHRVIKRQDADLQSRIRSPFLDKKALQRQLLTDPDPTSLPSNHPEVACLIARDPHISPFYSSRIKQAVENQDIFFADARSLAVLRLLIGAYSANMRAMW